MANSKQILVTLYFVLCFWFFVHGNDVGYLDGSEELQSLVRKMDELQNIVNTQSSRISQLEKQNRKLEETVTAQGEEIAILKASARDQMSQSSCEKNYSKLEKQFRSMMNLYKGNKAFAGSPNGSAGYSKQPQENFIRKGRLLAQPTSPPTSDNAIGFYSFFSQTVPNPSSLHILTFDTVITNAGNGYHAHTGTFVAPRSGLYVFTWTIRMYGTSYHTTEILVNNSVRGAIHFNPGSNVDGSASNTVVLHVNQGDDVFVRTSDKHNAGNIISDLYGRSSFAGWMIV